MNNYYFKNNIKYLLNYFHIDLTKNLKYDRLTRLIIRKKIKNGQNCIDIGCHKGEILEFMIKSSPSGKHFGFEPIPYLFHYLKKNYNDKANIFPYALSNKSGLSSFQFVKNAPAYSGINRRDYNTSCPDIEEIQVELKTLNEIIGNDTKIDFIKIDVEGGEFDVLKGGINLLKKFKPIIIFECGLGASNYYNTSPLDIYNFITKEINLNLSTLEAYIKKELPLNVDNFKYIYDNNYRALFYCI